MIRSISCAVAALALATSGAAAALTPNDFAYGVPLAVQQTGALHRVILPAAVYAYAVRRDLGDLRVFNGANEVVPYALREVPAVPSRQTRALPLFPLHTNAQVDDDSRIELRVEKGGRTVAITHNARNDVPKRLRGYVIDARALKDPVQSLQLQWRPTTGDMSAQIEVAASDDLSDWHTLASGAIAHLRHGQQVLQQDRIALPAGRYAYLRVTADDAFPVTLSQVHAEFAPATAPARSWWPVTITPRTAGEFALTLPGQVPAERIRIVPTGDAFLSRVELASRLSPAQAWVPRGAGLVYRMNVNDNAVANEEITLSSSVDREWRIKLMQAEGVGSGAFDVAVGWTPQELLFVARGAGPFRLAFGSVAAQPATFPLTDILAAVGTDAAPLTATAGAVASLGGESQRAALSSGLAMSIALWSLLALGVIALAAMAWRLYRNLEAPPPT